MFTRFDQRGPRKKEKPTASIWGLEQTNLPWKALFRVFFFSSHVCFVHYVFLLRGEGGIVPSKPLFWDFITHETRHFAKVPEHQSERNACSRKWGTQKGIVKRESQERNCQTGSQELIFQTGKPRCRSGPNKPTHPKKSVASWFTSSGRRREPNLYYR